MHAMGLLLMLTGCQGQRATQNCCRRDWDTSRKMFDMLADLTNQPADTKRQKRACTLNQAAAAKCDRQVSAPASTA